MKDKSSSDRFFSTAVAAGAFEIPWIKDLTKLISSSLRNNFDWLGVPQHDGGIKLLDYACGNGVVSMVKFPAFRSVLLPLAIPRFFF
jgi:hypothetical protein